MRKQRGEKHRTRRRAVRRFLTLIATAMVALAPVPAFAQQNPGTEQEPTPQAVVVTGVLEKPEAMSHVYSTHTITDEVSDALYALQSEEEGLLDDNSDRRVTVYGTLVSGYENGAVEGGPPLLNLARVEPSDPELGVDLNEDGVVDEADGEFAAEISDAARVASDEAGQPVLPATGGPTPPIGGVALLLVAGLLARYVLRGRLTVDVWGSRAPLPVPTPRRWRKNHHFRSARPG
jgi:hypothetical protein